MATSAAATSSPAAATGAQGPGPTVAPSNPRPASPGGTRWGAGPLWRQGWPPQGDQGGDGLRGGQAGVLQLLGRRGPPPDAAPPADLVGVTQHAPAVAGESRPGPQGRHGRQGNDEGSYCRQGPPQRAIKLNAHDHPSMLKISMELLTVEEAARMLRVSTVTIRRRIADGSLKALRVGRAVRLSSDAIGELIKPVEPRERRVTKGSPTSADDPLWDIVGMGNSGGPGDVAENVDKSLAEAYMPEEP